MVSATSAVYTLKAHYWLQIKSRQTLMLTITGLAGLQLNTVPMEGYYVAGALRLVLSLGGDGLIIACLA